MAYGIGRNIALFKWEINEADFLWNWNYFSSLIQIYELCFQHKVQYFIYEYSKFINLFNFLKIVNLYKFLKFGIVFCNNSSFKTTKHT